MGVNILSSQVMLMKIFRNNFLKFYLSVLFWHSCSAIRPVGRSCNYIMVSKPLSFDHKTPGPFIWFLYYDFFFSHLWSLIIVQVLQGHSPFKQLVDRYAFKPTVIYQYPLRYANHWCALKSNTIEFVHLFIHSWGV